MSDNGGNRIDSGVNTESPTHAVFYELDYLNVGQALGGEDERRGESKMASLGRNYQNPFTRPGKGIF